MASQKATTNSFSRRNFLALSSAIPVTLLAGAFENSALAAPALNEDLPTTAKKYPIGLELYSVRDELSRDLPKTLRAVAKCGYEVVEFYAPYYGWSIPYAKEVRAQMDDLGLRCLSTHNDFRSFTAGTIGKAIELNQVLGTRYMILSSAPGSAHGLEGWKKLCGDLTIAVEQLKPHGLSAGFHNHQTEWVKLDGDLRIMDVLAANTPKEFVLQLDVGTCVEAGQDPVAWIKANPGRIKSVHVKDWAPADHPGEKGYRVLFGEGVAPWKEIVAAVESVGGVEFYLLEQEGSRYSEFETAQKCLDAWKAFKNGGK